MTSDISYSNLSSVSTSCLIYVTLRGVQEEECAFMCVLYTCRASRSVGLIGAFFFDSRGLGAFKMNGRIVESVCEDMRGLNNRHNVKTSWSMALEAVTSGIRARSDTCAHPLSISTCAVTSDTASLLLPLCQEGKSIHFRKMPCESERTEVSVYTETEC